MSQRRTWLLIGLILVVRVLTQGWDSGLLSPHPDERQVAYVAERATGWFGDPGFYAYGSLHFHVVRALTVLEGRDPHYAGLLRGGRNLSLAASLMAILLGFWLARRAFGRRTANLLLVLAAFVPLDIQQSHYATVEAHHALWVMAALAALWWLARSGNWTGALLAGAATGASLAVKVSSLGLVVPLGAALLLVAWRRGSLRAAALGAGALTAALGVFWLGQPWAFRNGHAPLAALAGLALAAVVLTVAQQRAPWTRLGLTAVALVAAATGVFAHGRPSALLNPAWLRGVGEQVAMVAGRADLPYVRVYRHTLPVLYPLRELGLWGLGPALLLAALGGAVWAGLVVLGRRRRWIEARWNDGMTLLLILLAWTVPMSLRLATLRVKYLRYWEPLVVPAVLLAAWALTRLRFHGRLLRTGVIVLTAVWGLAYLSAFAHPHPHLTAAQWLNSVLERGQTIAFETWDETLKIKPGVSQVELPSYELPDDRRKVETWCQRLAKADWVVLTSNRVRRTVLANPGRFPETGRLYRLLLSGQAGFEILTTARRGPHLLGIRFPVQMADESFVNYDFPRVVILKRVRPVNAAALARRVARPVPFLEAMGSNALDHRFVDPAPTIEARPRAPAQLVEFLLWLLVFGGAAAAAWVLLLPLLRSWPDAGVGLALTTSWIGLAWCLWMGSELGIWAASATTATVLWLGLVGAGTWRALSLGPALGILWRKRRRAILTTLGVTAAVGTLFLLVRAFNPAIYWGEKPMDLSFLKAFLRATAWPPGEPWMAGMPLHYYYYGEVLAATPMKIAGTCAAVGYNLMAATVPALAAALLASFGLAVSRKRRTAAAALIPLLALLTGNLAWPWLLDLLHSHRYFDAWWATSRVIPGFAIDEYPLWTALFADLHAHFLALPVMLTALAWGWWTVHLGRSRHWVPAAALTGLAVASLAATNPWDILVLTAALGVGNLAASSRPLSGQLRLAVAAAISLAAAAPFLVELSAWLAAGVGGSTFLLTRQDFAPAWAVLRHFGVFLVPLLGAAGLGAGRWLLAAVPIGAVGAVAGLSFHSPAAALALGLAPLFAAAWARNRDRGLRLAFALAGLGLLVVAAAERFTLIDRMNTLFKTYNGVWVLLALALGIVILRSAGWTRRVAVLLWIPLEIAGLVNLPLGIYQGLVQPKAVSPKPTLDGEAYLAKDQPRTAFATSVLDAVAHRGDVVAEAAGPAYQDYTRMAMHTGLATVVGWEWHLQQRGQDRREIAARRHDLKVLYAGHDPARRRAVLDRYHVRWIVLGDLERSTYLLGPGPVLRDVPGVLPVASHDGMTVFQVLPATGLAGTREAAPLPAGLRRLSTLPVETAARLRALSRGAQGGTVVLAGGSVVRLDGRGIPVRAAPAPCATVGAALWRGRIVAACSDGTVELLGTSWHTIARLGRLSGLTAAEDLWVWGPGGLWRSADGRNWTRRARGPVVAAAAAPGRIAWATPGGVRRAWKHGRARLPLPGGAVRALAWEGADLWALTASGLQLSGGAVLPWRAVFPTLHVAALAGSDDTLWLGLDDGRLLEHRRPACASPWQRTPGGVPGGLAEPRGVAVSASGWFAVADTQHHRIRYFSLAGACLDTRGGKGAGPGQFDEPSGLALAPDGTLAIADTWNGRIQLLGPDGTFRIVGKSLFGPRGVAWTPGGDLLVADTGNHRLYRAAAPHWTLRLVTTLDAPVVGLAVLGGNVVAAAVPVRASVVLLDLATGTTVRTLPMPGWNTHTQQEGYLLSLGPRRLLASAPQPGELWLLDPSGKRPPRRVAGDLPGLTSMARLPNGRVLGALTFDNRLVRISVPAPGGS